MAPRYKAVVIGASAGGAEALVELLSALPETFPLPVLVAQHLHPEDGGNFSRHMASATKLRVVEPCDKEPILPGSIYTAPANYHMLAGRDLAINLSVDERVNWSRPSIDVLFESAALAWGQSLVGVLLSGANADGARGMMLIREAGGLTIAQAPADAKCPIMPQAAIDSGGASEILSAKEIGFLLARLGATEE